MQPKLHGGIERWFEPIARGHRREFEHSGRFSPSADRCSAALSPETPAWHIETHQFRIEAQPGVEEPADARGGIHRDGVDYVLVLLIDRRNIARERHDDDS